MVKLVYTVTLVIALVAMAGAQLAHAAISPIVS
jgi:hypothetical protein